MVTRELCIQRGGAETPGKTETESRDALQSGQLREGPEGVGGDHAIGGGSQFLQRSAELSQARVSHGDGDIAQKSGVAGARNGRAAEQAAEFGLAKRSQPLEWRREFAGFKGGVAGNGRAAVPGADILADVAAEDVRAHGGAVLH